MQGAVQGGAVQYRVQYGMQYRDAVRDAVLNYYSCGESSTIILAVSPQTITSSLRTLEANNL